MNRENFYIAFGTAYVCYKTGKQKNEIGAGDIKTVLEREINYFRLKTENNPELDKTLEFKFVNLQAGDAKRGIYLSPHIITSDKASAQTYSSIIKIVKALSDNTDLTEKANLDKAFAVMTAKINNGNKSQSIPGGTLYEAALCAVSAIASKKPAQYDPSENIYSALIPELEFDDMIRFIKIFEDMQDKGLADEAYITKIKEGKKAYRRPPFSYGNYPYAPPASQFAAIGLLAALGRWAKESETYPYEIAKVIKAMENARMYILSYNGVSQTSFSHAAVKLSEEGVLYDFIFSLYHTARTKFKDWDENKIKLFYLMTARFLQFFTPPYFRDFIAFRIEYQPEITKLLKEYFIMNGIKPEIVESAIALGKWINKCAYFAAKEGTDNKTDYDAINKAKAKVLAETESSIISAKTETALLSQVITRIGRLSYSDAPAEAEIFLKAAASGELALQNAKDLIMAFARIKSFKSENEKSNNYTKEEENED